MEIKITLKEILNKCDDWEKFCNEFGYGVYVVNEGGGDVEVNLTLEDLEKYGLNK